MIYIINYSCGCGDNIEAVEAESLKIAEDYAYERAKEEYESFAGLHGVQNLEDVCEDWGIEDTDSQEAYDAYNEVVENNIEYEARLADLNNEDDQEIIKEGVFNV